MTSFTEAVKSCLSKNYFGFSGRASRAEYWWFRLFVFSILCAIAGIGFAVGVNADEDTAVKVVIPLFIIFYILILIPSIAVEVRRLHDTSHSGWWVLAPAIPFVGNLIAIYVLVLVLSDSDEGENEYGPNPYENEEIED